MLRLRRNNSSNANTFNLSHDQACDQLVAIATTTNFANIFLIRKWSIKFETLEPCDVIMAFTILCTVIPISTHTTSWIYSNVPSKATTIKLQARFALLELGQQWNSIKYFFSLNLLAQSQLNQKFLDLLTNYHCYSLEKFAYPMNRVSTNYMSARSVEYRYFKT